jgi:hypothetical protein
MRQLFVIVAAIEALHSAAEWRVPLVGFDDFTAHEAFLSLLWPEQIEPESFIERHLRVG